MELRNKTQDHTEQILFVLNIKMICSIILPVPIGYSLLYNQSLDIFSSLVPICNQSAGNFDVGIVYYQRYDL